MLGKDLLTYWQLETDPQMPGQILRRSSHKENLAANYQYQIMQLQQHQSAWPFLPVSRLAFPAEDVLVWSVAGLTPFTEKYPGKQKPADVRQCLTQISAAMLKLEEFLLWPNRLLLALDQIYVQSAPAPDSHGPADQLLFLYVPASQTDSPIEPNEQELLWRFIQDCLSRAEWTALLSDHEIFSLQQAAAQGACGLTKLLEQADFLPSHAVKPSWRERKARQGKTRPVPRQGAPKEEQHRKANAGIARLKQLLQQPYSFPILMLEELTLLLLANLCFSIFLKESDWLFLVMAAGLITLLLICNIYLLASPQSPYRIQTSQFEKVQAQAERRSYEIGKRQYQDKRSQTTTGQNIRPAVPVVEPPDKANSEMALSPAAELYDLAGGSAAAYKQLFRDIAFRAHEVYPLAVLVSKKTFLGHSQRHCNVRLTDSSVDAIHARIDCLNGQYQITDLDSVHGTFVNGIRLSADSPYPLRGDETITLGQKNLFFRLDTN